MKFTKFLREHLDLLLGTTLFILTLSIYVYTAAPSVYDGDSGELTEPSTPSATIQNLASINKAALFPYTLTDEVLDKNR